MSFTAQDARVLEEVLRWRRDVRHFRTTPIDEAVIEAIHAAMELAPSVGNARPWRVVRVESAGARAAVRASFEACTADAADTYTGERRAAYLRLKLAGLDAAPLQLAVFTLADPAEGHGLGRHTLPQTLDQSTAMAIHTLWLAARVRDIGMGMVSILDGAAVERICAVPPSWRFSAYLCLGYPEQEDDTPLLHRLGWQANTR
ncbi:MAG TPA: 5,6-dimethylbenzimidazole synthase, partial [Novosphingobium sp.]|nr:5,6-dimethylbenzimidazole synthase [Novosphingobium sp.]